LNIVNNGKLNNNINRFGQQPMKQKNNVDVSSSENFMNKERTNNFMCGNNPIDMKVNNSVNIPKSNMGINALNPMKNSSNMNNNYILNNKNIIMYHLFVVIIWIII